MYKRQMIDSRYPAYKGSLPVVPRMQAALQKWAYHAALLGRSKATEIPAYVLQRIKTLRHRAQRFWQQLEYVRAIQNAEAVSYTHLDVYKRQIETGQGPAHTGCLAFGWERLALAFVAQHGVDEKHWPAGVVSGMKETLLNHNV